MNAERQRRPWTLPLLGLVGLAILALVTSLALRAPRSHSTLIYIDSNGITRLGPLPLRNTNLRESAFTAVSYLNQGTASPKWKIWSKP